MNSFYIIANQLFQFFVMMFCGYMGARAGIIPKAFLGGLAKLIMGLLMPILIFANVLDGTTRQILLDCYPVLLLSLGIYIGLIITQAALAYIMGLKGSHSHVYQATMIFGNAGFIGIPLLSTAFPGQGGIYIALLSIVDQIALWTYGIYLTSPVKSDSSFHIKSFINPAVIAIALALGLLLLGVPVPGSLEHSLLTVGRAATPLALIYVGALLYYSHWNLAAKTKELYVGILSKMLIFPIVFFVIASRFCHDASMVQAMTLVAGLPTMTAIAMFAQSKNNHGEYALSIVLLTTIASLFTMTIVSYIVFSGL